MKMNVVNFLPQRDSAEHRPRVQRTISDKWDFHVYRSRRLFLQLPRFSKKQSKCEELVWAKVENESNYSSIFFFFTSSVYWFILGRGGHIYSLVCFAPSHPGVSEADEGQRRTRGTLRHVRGLPGHLWLGALGAAGGRHGVAGGDQVQHHREPEQHQPHLHRLPDLPHHLKHSLKQHLSISGFWGHWEDEMFCLFYFLWKHKEQHNKATHLWHFCLKDHIHASNVFSLN